MCVRECVCVYMCVSMCVCVRGRESVCVRKMFVCCIGACAERHEPNFCVKEETSCNLCICSTSTSKFKHKNYIQSL